MENKQLKNMIVLKNLPSNMIEEAIVVLKKNKKIEITQQVEKKEAVQCRMNSNEYIVKEAELVISSYISEIEKNKKAKKVKNIEQKYKKARFFSIALLVLMVVQAILFCNMR